MAPTCDHSHQATEHPAPVNLTVPPDVVHTNVEFAAQLTDHDSQVAKLSIP
jgi:hypothetical protein